jgi:restriction endonuclease S subunit
VSDLVCLGDVITLEYGRSLPAALRRAGNVPVYGSNGITGWHDEALIEGPVIVVGRKGSIGEVQYEPGPAFPIDTTYYAQPRPGVSVDFRYLFYMLRVAGLTELNSGTGVPGLNREHAYRVRTRLPPLDEQRRIVGLLDRAAEIRRRADAARAKARAIIPALFLDTFGDPATNPKGWRSVELDDLCDLVRGSSPRPQGDRRFFGGPVPRLMISDITRDGTYVTPRTDSLTIEGAARSRPMKAEDVVMAVSGAVGLPAILAIDACIHDGFVGFRNLRKDVTAQYFYYYLLVSRRASQSQAVGATFQNLNTDQIRRWIVPIPPEKHQRIFTETAQRLDSLARHLDAAAAKAEAMVAGLSAEMFG